MPQISYLRISITDKCNLKCLYCSTSQARQYLPHGDLLSYEEILKIQDAAAAVGIKKIRITGGEPLVRKNVAYLIHEMHSRHPEIKLAVTTNAQMLHESGILKEKISGINISIDSLNERKYREMTRGGELKKALSGLHSAIEANIQQIKVNAVLIRGVNDEEILPFAMLAKDFPIAVRFIEYMPFGKNGWSKEQVLPGYIVRQTIEKHMSIFPIYEHSEYSKGPESRYLIKGGHGSLGFINPISHQFCSMCNRLRVTCSGNLKPCLFSSEEIDIKSIIRDKNFSLDRLINVFRVYMDRKVKSLEHIKPGQGLNEYPNCNSSEMWTIGG